MSADGDIVREKVREINRCAAESDGVDAEAYEFITDRTEEILASLARLEAAEEQWWRSALAMMGERDEFRLEADGLRQIIHNLEAQRDANRQDAARTTTPRARTAHRRSRGGAHRGSRYRPRRARRGGPDVTLLEHVRQLDARLEEAALRRRRPKGKGTWVRHTCGGRGEPVQGCSCSFCLQARPA